MRTQHLGIAAVAALALLVTGCATAQPGSTVGPGMTADPQPTEIAPTESAPPAPSADDDASATPIPDERLADIDVMGAMGDQGVASMWAEPGSSLAVFIGGSGSTACVPQPDDVDVEDGGTIVVEFEAPSDPDIACTADYRIYGWTFALDEAVDASGRVQVRVEGLSPADDAAVELEVAPDQILP